VVDATKAAVGGATVTLDEHGVGATTATGSLDVGGLAAGVHRLAVEAPGFAPMAREITVKGAKTPVEVKLAALARPVAVTARAPGGPARDALVRAYGAEVQPPAAVDDAGRRALRLEPGPWTLVAVSEQYGIAQNDLDVAPGTTPIPVELQLTPPAADRGTLLVEVVDPAGRPVPGATLTVDGASRTLGAAGLDVLADRAPGPVKLAAAAPGYRPGLAETVAVSAGVQTRRLRLEWLPRPVQVRVGNAAGAPVDAEVRVLGPGRTAPVATRGGVATFSLLPGTWQVIASAPGYGPWRTEVDVAAGAGAVEVVAELAAEKVEVTRTSVVIREQVQFAFDKADIDPASHAVLGQVASTLLLHPEIRRIEVQGHSDTRGTEAYNQDLSQRRAEAVRAYLIGQGVEPGRIEAHGYGASRPMGDNATEAGRARNRRVQFEIVATEPGSPAPP
jgi:outer membrane protein OmpA-like peptidoglycan-associated protein